MYNNLKKMEYVKLDVPFTTILCRPDKKHNYENVIVNI